MTPSAVCASRSVCPAGAGSKVVITIGPSVSACNQLSSARHAGRHHLVSCCRHCSLAPGRCIPAGAARISLPPPQLRCLLPFPPVPQCQEVRMLERLLQAGVSCARVDLSWGTKEYHACRWVC